MATLSGKTTSGIPAWKKYVEDNPKWKGLELVIENKVKTYLFNDKLEEITELKAGDKLKIVNKITKQIGRVKYAKVKHKGKTGLVAISKIRKPTNTDVLKEEVIAFNKLDSRIKELVKHVGPIDIIIKGDPKKIVYKNIVGARNVTEKVNGREAKSDFNLVDVKGKDQIFISHKKAGGAKAFQQYGGVSKKSSNVIYEHPEVQRFLKVLIDFVEDDKLVHPVYREIKDIKLIGYSVFGSEYGSSSFSIENVQIIGQGNPVLTTINDNLFEVSFDDHLVYNSYPQEFTKGAYKAILGATFRAGRTFEVNGQKYRGTRVGIYPIDMIKNRKGAIEI